MKLNKVTINETKEIIKTMIGYSFKNQVVPKNIYVAGSPGVGKSETVMQVKRELELELGIDIEVIDVRLSCMEAADVNGIPYNADTGEFYEAPNGQMVAKKEMAFSTPTWFPTDISKYYILLFDETSNAAPSVQHAAYRVWLDRTIQNGAKLPDTCAIIGAGNLKSDKTGAKSLMAAAANRFAIHLEIDKDRLVESFIEYAFENKFQRSIIAYIQWKPTALFNRSGDEDAFATPRSWSFVNEHLEIYKNSPYMSTVIAGAIGTATAIDFEGFREFDGRLPDFKKIRSGEVVYEFPLGEDQIKWAASTGITYEIIDMLQTDLAKNRDDEAEQLQMEMTNIVALLNQLPQEMQIVLFRGLAKQKNIVAKMFKFPSLRETYSRIASYVNQNIR